MPGFSGTGPAESKLYAIEIGTGLAESRNHATQQA